MSFHPYLSLIFLFAFTYLFLYFKSIKRKTSPPFGLNYDDGFPIFGHLPQFLLNRHRFLDWTTELLAASQTNTVTIRRPIRGVITANPANLEYILKINCHNYPKGLVITSTLRDFLVAASLTLTVRRKAAFFEFNTKSLRTFVVDHVKNEISTRLIPLLRNYASTGEVLDF